MPHRSAASKEKAGPRSGSAPPSSRELMIYNHFTPSCQAGFKTFRVLAQVGGRAGERFETGCNGRSNDNHTNYLRKRQRKAGQAAAGRDQRTIATIARWDSPPASRRAM